MNITGPIYSDANKAREHLEALHWPQGPMCPHCGCMGNIKKLAGKSTRPGVHKCNDCEKPFTVTVGTIMEDSKIPLNKWLMAFALMSSSKKGISAHQLHRSLGITYKSAWFLAHRIREAMKSDDITPLGGAGKTVEVDETFIGGKEKNRHKSMRANRNMGASWGKETVFSLVERDGRVRSMHVASVTAANLRPIMIEQINAASMLCTDDAGQYRHMGRDFSHEVVNHGSDEYVRGKAHTNTVEGYFSILKRGIIGCYFHVSPAHLHRYLAEFDFRYSNRSGVGVNDAERTELAIKGARGRRLAYRQPDTLAA
ncbi:IS1595 family transposase [Sphingomonas xinjiangensis]|uniref:Transposase-like protein n=1 Tax=Sphingomonas xinjiangensis TaxID=643568 RepID=A0A840YDR5_9SPHN|nr:IS1595 family transposase [Sphingomonas xinjiangensis]MBB5711557.1 transposase-like protein [Sphingomonas xinjiangensis]